MPMMRNPFRKQDEAVRPVSEKPDAQIKIDSKQPTEYKLSEINNSGEYLPPSPTERSKTFWSGRSNTSTTSSNPRSVMGPDEPFNISRESFDSYRRSFDISARSPVMPQEGFPRASLDSRLPMQSRHSSSFTRPEPTVKEDFEDVGLNDDPKPVKKRGFFGRFGDSTNDQTHESGGHHFHIGGRKRGQSGTGQELGDMKGRPGSSGP